jgi:hypothetical protein
MTEPTPTPAPIVVTDEMRRAVMQEICREQGHAVSLMNLSSGNGDLQVRSADAELLPHIFCSRCKLTWVILGEPGEDYDDAEMKLRERVYKSDPINKRPERRQNKKVK